MDGNKAVDFRPCGLGGIRRNSAMYVLCVIVLAAAPALFRRSLGLNRRMSSPVALWRKVKSQESVKPLSM